MKVITIGRSSENTVCINDPFVGRHHCQIIQYDDGTYSVIDMRSTNGTYVNGGRIYGEARLKPNDTVTIGHTSLPWMSYFNPVPQPSKTNSKTLPIVLGSIGGALVVVAAIIIALIFGSAGDLGDGEVWYNGPEPTITVVTLQEDGERFEVCAVEGQVVVMFNEAVPHKEAVSILKKYHARIIAQMPDVHCYLVKVQAGKESELFSRLRIVPEVDYVFPNAIEELCSVTPYVLDNFYSDHGERVVAMLEERGVSAEKRNLGIEGDKRGRSDSYKGMEYLKNMLDNLGEDESAVVNMSFAPGLVRLGVIYDWEGWEWQHNRVLWDDAFVTICDKNSYKEVYRNSLKRWLELVEAYDDKDFIIVKAIGNEGMKEMEKILKQFKKDLNDENKYALFERHFILVSAKDDNKEGDYPNDVKTYSKLVTKVDISDKTAQDLHWQGTSFASPRAAGIITAVANKYDKKVVDVLEYARKATLLHPEHLLTMEDLSKLIAEDNPSISNVGNQGNNPSTRAETKQGIPVGLVGTKWCAPANSPTTIEFIDRNHMKISHKIIFGDWEETILECYYDPNEDRVVAISQSGTSNYRYEDGRLFSLGYYTIGGWTKGFEYDRL